MDDADRAAQELERQEARREQARLLAKQQQLPSATECIECGEPIPEERQKALPGVQLCVECQELEEIRGRR